MFTKRGLLLPLMTTFDFCDTTQPCGRRDVTTVAPQALALLNNHFVHEVSETLARRVARAAGPEPAARVALAWRLTLGRDPSPRETESARVHLDSRRDDLRRLVPTSDSTDPEHLALASLCLVLLNTNEFIYID